MKRHTTTAQHANFSTSNITQNNASTPNILLRFLSIVGNVTVGIVFLQHLYQAQEDSNDLARVTKVASQLLQEVDDLKEENEYYTKELKLYEHSLIEIEEAVHFCQDNLIRSEMEMDVLNEKIYDPDVTTLSLKKGE